MLDSRDTGRPSANRSLWENKLGKADKLRARQEAVNADKKCGSECMSLHGLNNIVNIIKSLDGLMNAGVCEVCED